MKLSERIMGLERPALGILSPWGPYHNPPSTQAVSGIEKPGQVRGVKPEELCNLLGCMTLGSLDRARGKKEIPRRNLEFC